MPITAVFTRRLLHSKTVHDALALEHGSLTGLTDDDHTQYQKESEKGATSGYASLDSAGKVPDSQILDTITRDSELAALATSVADLDGTSTAGAATTASKGDHEHGFANDAIAYAKIQNVSATDRLLGRDTAGAGDIEELTAAAVRTMLDVPTTGEAVLDTLIDAKGDVLAGTAADAIARLAVGANGTVLTADSAQSTGLAWAASGGGTSPVLKTADESTSSDTTLTNDTHLLWSVGTNEVWGFLLMLTLTSGNVTMDYKLGWSVPSGTTMKWGTFNPGSTANLAGYAPSVTTAGALAAVFTESSTPGWASAATGTEFGGIFHGIVDTAGTAGTVNLQWAQNTSDAATLTVKQNSNLMLWQLA